MDAYVINVFSETGIKGGNQLGVFPNSANLSHDLMQIITRQMNYSESTFVTNITNDSISFKIFIPERELEFAGHPTIGTAYLMELLHRKESSPREKLRIHLKGGDLNIYFDKDLELTYMDQLAVEKKGLFEENFDLLLDSMNLSESDLLSTSIPLITPSSLNFIYIPVKNPELIRDMKPDFSKMLSAFGESHYEPYVFSPSGLDGGDVRARLFAPKSGITEDPATGSAQAALIHAMEYFDLLNGRSSIIVEQGYEMNRPSKLYNRISYDNNQISDIKTGGKCHLSLSGKIHI